MTQKREGPAELLEELMVRLLARPDGSHQAVVVLGPHDVAHLVLAQVHRDHPPEDRPAHTHRGERSELFLFLDQLKCIS